MMMMKCMAVALAATVLSAGAYEVPMGTRFEKPDAEGMPSAWQWHTYGGYMPHGDVQVPETGTLRLFNVRGKEGSYVRSRTRLAVKDDDLVTVSLSARGEGTANYTFYLYDAKGGWVRALQKQTIRLVKGKDRTLEFAFVVKGLPGRAAAWAELALGVAPGSDATFRDVRVSRRLVEERVLASDDFEDAAKTRAGNPERIVDHIAPGLLSPTGQGVYQTKDRVDLVPEHRVAMPSAAEGAFLTGGVRLYAFGRRVRGDSRLVTALADDAAEASVVVEHRAASETLVCRCPDGGRLEVPYAALPVDVAFSANGEGLCELVVTSLADSSMRSRTFKADFFRKAAGREISRRVSFVSDGKEPAEVSVDNLVLARSVPERQRAVKVAYRANPEPTFDPVKAGWPLVFSDEFEGDAVDFSKWERASSKEAAERQLKYAHVKDGALHIAADRAPGSTNLVTASFWSREDFGYGYFESRLRFTTYNGWWAAFWLCQHAVGNPFLDGFEIDIFEDYYMRNEPRNTLDHNLHTHCAGTLKSWNYNSVLPGGPGDWYVIGCKWTPLEITYYLNGKAIAAKAKGGPYETVTFDAFRNAACICPLKAIVSGQIMKTAYGRHDPVAGEAYPEYFDVDWVRVYRWPGSEPGKAPKVEIARSASSSFFVSAGRQVEVRAQVKAAKSGAKIRAVHLFDNGCHLLTKTEAPYDFVVPMTKDFFAGTAWMKPGRSGVRPVFEGSQHVFCVFAEDEDGMVGHSGTVELRVAPKGRSTPYGGVAQKVPGTIVIGRYDEGGNGIAYYDSTDGNACKGWRETESVDGMEHVIGGVSTGEWVNYTVDVAAAGSYRLRFHYGTPVENPRDSVLVLVDGEHAGRITGMKAHRWDDWRVSDVAEIPLALPAGIHTISFHFSGAFNIGDFELLR